MINRVRKRIDEIFGPKDIIPEKIRLTEYVQERLKELQSLSSHRKLEIISRLEPAPIIMMPRDPLRKVIDGIVKNAIENTPDEGKLEVSVHQKAKGAELVVRDYGVGITKDHQRRIFEGFFATQETIDYSSKTPFDFNAGGKGSDLLRMKIFSKRYGFKVDMVSSRCRFIPKSSDVWPGKISECKFCTNKEDCYHSGGTTFSLYFPPAL